MLICRYRQREGGVVKSVLSEAQVRHVYFSKECLSETAVGCTLYMSYLWESTASES
jgi:hypothetical protein